MQPLWDIQPPQPPEHRVIMHLDMNSYFASCEQQQRPEWRGLPIGVCEHLGGIIIAPSIEAKVYGVKTAMPVWEAKKLCPDIILTPTTPGLYRYYTKKFLTVLNDYTDVIEKYSIDEAFVDLTKACTTRQKQNNQWSKVDPWVEANRIAEEIKDRFPTEVGDWLRCSIGIAGNKLLAKIGSDALKPDGVTIIRPEDKDLWYEKLKLIDIPGIGRRMQNRLNEIGINTLSQLRDYPASQLIREFGINGLHLHAMGQLRGSWKEGFAEEGLKSIGHMYTVAKEFRRAGTFAQVLAKLSEMVAARLRVNQLWGSTLFVHAQDGDGQYYGRGHKLGRYIIDGGDIYSEAMSILKKIDNCIDSCHRSVRFVGVSIGQLRPWEPQLSLFGQDERSSRLNAALDKINTKYEDFTVARSLAWQARDIIRDSVGFGRMKEFKTSHVRGSRGRFA